jgi:capsular exopolysaccharide synthesis family protein
VDLRDYALVLRKRWRLIALCTLLAIAASLAATLAATPMYQASSQLFVSTASGADGNIAGLQQGGQFAQQRVKSYADIVDSENVTDAVVRDLGLEVSGRQLAEQIEASAPLDTVLINVDVTDADPVRAQAIANAVAERFSVVAPELETPEGEEMSPVKVSVVRTAELPETPVSPRPKLNLALGLLVGLAVGVGAAVLRETLDTSVKGAEDVQEHLDLPTLGLIAYDPEAGKRPLIVHVDPQSTRSEAFRQLRTNLQFVDIDHKPRSIVVTSSVPQEGKSTTTCNLALALTQAGLKVILVEADLRRPRLAEYLGMEGAIGLTDALVGRAELDDLLQPWGDGRLQVLASGPTPPNPSELLGSHQMGELMREMERRADLVLLDAPPLLPVTDAAVLTAHASGAIVVVRSGHTTREQARRAVEILRAVDAHLYGAVLNMVPTKGPGAYKYGYYGYGYAATGPIDTTPAAAHPPAGPAAAPAPTAASPVPQEAVVPAPPVAAPVSRTAPSDLAGSLASLPHAGADGALRRDPLTGPLPGQAAPTPPPSAPPTPQGGDVDVPRGHG